MKKWLFKLALIAMTFSTNSSRSGLLWIYHWSPVDQGWDHSLGRQRTPYYPNGGKHNKTMLWSMLRLYNEGDQIEDEPTDSPTRMPPVKWNIPRPMTLLVVTVTVLSGNTVLMKPGIHDYDSATAIPYQESLEDGPMKCTKKNGEDSVSTSLSR